MYNDIEYLKDEPQKVVITCEEDIHVTEEVYKRPVFTMPAYRCSPLFSFLAVARKLPTACVVFFIPGITDCRCLSRERL